MVYKIESMKKKKSESEFKEPKKEAVRLNKACKFKRSCFSEEEDAASFAILLLACVVCSPNSM